MVVQAGSGRTRQTRDETCHGRETGVGAQPRAFSHMELVIGGGINSQRPHSAFIHSAQQSKYMANS